MQVRVMLVRKPERETESVQTTDHKVLHYVAGASATVFGLTSIWIKDLVDSIARGCQQGSTALSRENLCTPLHAKDIDLLNAVSIMLWTVTLCIGTITFLSYQSNFVAPSLKGRVFLVR